MPVTTSTTTSQQLIRVEFIEATSNELLLVRNMPAGQLPESFEHHTSFELGAFQWVVTQAEPSLLEEAVVSGGLKLWLHRHHTTSREPRVPAPAHDLFAPATRCATYPSFEQGQVSDVDHEDHLWLYVQDWRQNEVLNDDVWHDYVSQTCQAIAGRPMYSTYSRQVPQELQSGVSGGVSKEALFEHMDGEEYEGVVLFFKEHDQRVIEGGFAFDGPCGTTFYGVTDEQGLVDILCVHDWDEEQDLRQDLATLARLLGPSWVWMSWENSQRVRLEEIAK